MKVSLSFEIHNEYNRFEILTIFFVIGCSGSPRLQRRKKGRHRAPKNPVQTEKEVPENVDELTYIDSLPEV